MIPSIESTQLSLVLKQPMGVVGAIVPWNYPLLLLSWKLAPALAASNASGQAVGADAALDARAGGMLHHLPPGVPNLLAGAGDGRIDCVAFTGSGRHRQADRCHVRRARGAYGLGATVYTRDLRTVVRCLHEIKAGTLCSTIR